MEEARHVKVASCFRFDSELGAYLEGESRPAVAAHAQECPFCGVILADLERLRTVARQLPDQEPSPVVWSNLRATLEQEGLFRAKGLGWRWFQPWRFVPNPAPVATLACLVILGSIFVLPLRIPEAGRTSDFASSSARTTQASQAYPSEHSGVALVVQELEKTYKANEKLFTPGMKATYAKSLSSLDRSIQECMDSLQQEPDNTLARDYLLTAYTRKAEILTSALEFAGR